MALVSSKKMLKAIRESKMITKMDFAKRLGISTPTLYAWIRKNKDGIADYVTPEGISPEIFEVEPWNAYNDETLIERQQMQDQIDELVYEADTACDKINKLTGEIDKLTAENELLHKTVEMLQGQISVKDQQINALLVSLNQQMKALPAPKEHWWNRRRKKDAEELS